MTLPPERSQDAAVRLPVRLIDAVSVARHRSTSERPAVVAVDGPAGSGKTTIAAVLAGLLGDARHPAPVVHMDDLYPGWDGLADAVPLLVDQVLEPLATGGPARWRRYDWVEGRYAEEHQLPVTPAVVVEGVACGSLPCAPYLALLVWVDAPHDLRLSRGLARDGETFRPHWERWAAQERAHFAAHRTRERADLRLETGTGSPELVH